MSTPQLSPGTVVDGRFTVGNAVRTREGATVYDATDAQAGPCSVTVYGAACFPSGLVLERSLRELRQLQSVSSTRLMQVVAAGKVEGGVYEATPTLPPQTLTEAIAGGPLSMSEAAALVVQVGEALLEAQRVGVIHRSLGGDVIFPSPEGVRVTGFAVGEPQGTGSFGSLTTMAPEQVQGKVVDQRTLIYNVAALMHWMLSGRPLFAGEQAAVLELHNTGDVPGEVHEKLKRALGKDPRMRPMMLKQFLGEIAALGGVEPPKPAMRVAPTVKSATKAPVATPSSGVAPPATTDGRKPSSRGWTMFMKAADDEADPASTPAPATAAGEKKPSTRGWTMFMQDEEGVGSQPVPDQSGGEPAAAQQPEAAAPATPPAEGEKKPSTRGWTMFMQAQDGEGGGEEAAAPPTDAAEPQPSTRGWTMFMNEGEEGAGQEAPAAEAPAGEPTTRGWTMFMNEGEKATADAGAPGAPPAADAQPPAPAPPVAVAPVAADAAPGGPSAETPDSPLAPPPEFAGEPDGGPDARPTSSGWTMFTGDGPPPGGPEEGAPTAPAEEAAPPVAAAADGHAPDDVAAPGAQKKRGWTMFMDAPIAELAVKDKGPEEDAPAAPAPVAPAAETGPGASDKKGWTVFGEPSPLAGGASSPTVPDPVPEHPPVQAAEVAGDAIPERGKTVMVTGTPAGQAPGVADRPPPSPPVASSDSVTAGAATRSKTVIATGVPVQQGPGGGVTGRPAANPDTMYFKRGQSEPEKPVVSPRSSTARDIEAPASVRPAQERQQSSGHVPRPTTIPPSGAPASGSKALYIIIGVAAVGAIATAAYFAFG